MVALSRLLPLRPSEARLALALFFQGFFAVGSIITARTVRDTLFLAHSDRSALAWMYVVSAGVVTTVGVLGSRWAARARRDRVATATAAVCAAIMAGFWVVERTHERWVYPALYVFAELIAGVLVVQFWTLANELFNAREAKRIYGLIGAGGTFASIALGLLGAKVATRLGASWLLPLAATLLFATAVMSRIAGSLGRQRFTARAASLRHGPVRARGGASSVMQSSHLRTLALLAAVTYVAITLVDYAFKVVAAKAYATDHLAAFFSYFSVSVGVLAVALQIFGTSRLLDRLGVIGALALLPLTLTLGSASLALFATLWAAALTKGADSLLRYSLYDSTTQILYLPVPSHTRARAKAFIDGVIRPLATGLAGVVLVVLARSARESTAWIAWLSTALGGVWIWLVFVQRRHYVRALHDNLKKPVLDAAAAKQRLTDEGPESAVGRSLDSADAKKVRSALAVARELSAEDLGDRIVPLLENRDELVRVAVLEHCARARAPALAVAVGRCLDDERPAVRAAAIEAYSAILGDDAVARVRAFLTDPEPRLRSAAMVGLLRYAGLDGVEAAVSTIKAAIASEDASMRAEAARVLGAAGVRNFYQPLVELMSDPDRGVRRAAITAAGRLGSPELVSSLVERAGSPDTLLAAVDALSGYGAEVVPRLATELARPGASAELRVAVARVLARIGDAASVSALGRHLDDENDELRHRVYRALARAAKSGERLVVVRSAIERALTRELGRAHRVLADCLSLGLEAAGGAPSPKLLLATAMSERLTRIEDDAFQLLGALFPDADMERIHANFRSGAQPRANAVELLDNLLDSELKRRLVPLLDDLPQTERLRLLDEVEPLEAASEKETLLRLCRDDSPWVRACAVWYACSSDDAPVERAKWAEDPSSLVRDAAAQGEPKVISTIEKVLIFKSIDLFSQLRGDDLAQIALIASEESYDLGEEIFAAGEAADGLFMIIEGHVRVHVLDREIALLGPRECFGEMAILDASPRSASVTALSNVALLKISRENFEAIMSENPLIALGIVKVLSRRLRDAIS